MTLEEALTPLEALGTEKMRAQNTKISAGDNQFGKGELCRYDA